MHSLDEALKLKKFGSLKENFAKPKVGESKQISSSGSFRGLAFSKILLKPSLS
jgi:hypothetical protein